MVRVTRGFAVAADRTLGSLVGQRAKHQKPKGVSAKSLGLAQSYCYSCQIIFKGVGTCGSKHVYEHFYGFNSVKIDSWVQLLRFIVDDAIAHDLTLMLWYIIHNCCQIKWEIPYQYTIIDQSYVPPA